MNLFVLLFGAGLALYLFGKGRLTQLWDEYAASQSSLLEGMRHVGTKVLLTNGGAAAILAEDPTATDGLEALYVVHTAYFAGGTVYFGVDANGIGYLYSGLLEPAMSGLKLPCVFTVLVGPTKPWPPDVAPPDGTVGVHHA